jgi:hypothetical protein
MHKGVILLVKADSKEDALDQVTDFMEPYGEGDVWDWYSIGGRWNNTLAPEELLNQFKIKVDNEILIKKEGSPWISQQQVDDNQEFLQKAWEEVGLVGLNSYCNHYDIPSEGNTYDVVKLEDCLSIVKEWVKDLKKASEEIFEKLVEAKNKALEGEYDMSGYYAGIYKDLNQGNFSFETNVYDITTNYSETIPEDIIDYYAVMVDMHN